VTEHHGLDLEKLTGPKAAHSVYAPSSAAGWLTCPDYILANINLPDDAGEDAAYGTVGHEVAEEWLLRIQDIREGEEQITEEMAAQARPDYLVGTIRPVVEPSGTFNIKITEEMLAYVSQYIARCAEMPGKHMVEQRGDFSSLTPIKNQKGTADFISMEPGVLRVRDLKMGISPRNRVDAAEYRDDIRAVIDGRFNGNPQALIYAIAMFLAWDHVYHFERIIIYIDQPRLDHFDEWETTREELISFMAFVKERAYAAWAKERPRVPSEKGCKWCKAKPTCTAYVAFHQDAYDDVWDDDDDIPLGQAPAMTPERMSRAVARLESQEDEPPAPNPAVLTTAHLLKILAMKKSVEDFLSDVLQEVMNRKSRGEDIPQVKLVRGREGRRKLLGIDDPDDPQQEWILSELRFLGLTEEDIWKHEINSPAQLQEKLKSRFGLKDKVAKMMLADLVKRDPGKDTLVFAHDKRPEIEDYSDALLTEEDDDELAGL